MSGLAEAGRTLRALASGGPLDRDALLAADEEERFPSEALAALHAEGWSAHHVPVELGGAFDDHHLAAAKVRLLAGVDLTVAIAHGKTVLGAAAVWHAGTADQRESLARRVLAGQPVSFALTEPAHGSDLLAMTTRAARDLDGDGYRLDGEKWLVNNAGRCGAAVVFARTRPEGGARGFSTFLVEPDRLPAGAWTPTPKIRTHGIRSADISGFRLHRAPVSGDARIGPEGHGVQVVLETLQRARTIVPSLSVGALDLGLRITWSYATERGIYGARVVDLPSVRHLLASAYLDLRIAEAVVTAASRGLHAAPEESSVAAAVAKSFVPPAVERTLGRLASVLGARRYVREGPTGAFQKLERDHALVPLFDGSSVVNLSGLSLQVPRLAEAAAGGPSADVDAWMTVPRRLPPVDGARLRLAARNDSLMASLPSLSGPVGTAADRVFRALVALRSAPALGNPRRQTAGQLDAAARYGALWAAAACLHLAARAHEDPAWATLAADHLTQAASLDASGADLLFQELAARIDGDAGAMVHFRPNDPEEP